MIPQATFLARAGYRVLLFDWRAHGESEGTMTTFGRHEVDDLRAALDYLQHRPDLGHPRFGGLGVSYGAAMMLLGAAQDHRLAAIVADSIYIYPTFAHQFEQMNHQGMDFGPIHVPAAPFVQPIAELALGGHLADLDPLKYAPAVSPSALLLIHTAHDHYAFTPLSGAQQVLAAARAPKALWISPLGDHATAVEANPAAYQRQVLAFFATYLPLR